MNAGYSTDSGGTSQNTIKSVKIEEITDVEDKTGGKSRGRRRKALLEANSRLSKDSGKVDETEESTAPLRYPYTKIDEHDDYMKIEVKEFSPPGLSLAEGSRSLSLKNSDDAQATEKTLHTIILPIPEGISDTKNADWQDGGMGPIRALLGATVNSTLDGSENRSLASSLKSGSSEILSQFNSLAGSDRAQIQNLVTGGTAGLIANALTGGGLESAITRSTGLAVNKNQQLLFNGITQRSFDFSWDIVPRSRKEAQQVKVIIRLLKQSMSPQRDGYQTLKGLFLKSPDVFQLTYMKGKEQHPFLNAFKPTALTGMSVNYTGSGTYATYHDGNPVHLKLSLSFSELTAVYRDDYSTVQSGSGVGY